jgi:tetratricopeptide (TPR) repeat protein
MLEALDIIAYWTIIAGNIEQAIVLGYRQLRLAEDFGKPRFIARALSNIGFAAGQQTKSDSSTRNQARVHLLKALEIARSLQDTLLESTCLNSLGRLSRIEQDWQKALALHQRAFQQAKAIKNPEQEAWSLHSMGAIYEALKLYDSAMIFAKEAYNIRTKAKQDFGEAVSLRLIALLHFRLKNYEIALKYLKQSIQACQNHEGLFLVKLEAYRLLVIIYKELGNNSGELEAFRNYVIIKDSAEVIESQKSITNAN